MPLSLLIPLFLWVSVHPSLISCVWFNNPLFQTFPSAGSISRLHPLHHDPASHLWPSAPQVHLNVKLAEMMFVFIQIEAVFFCKLFLMMTSRWPWVPPLPFLPAVWSNPWHIPPWPASAGCFSYSRLAALPTTFYQPFLLAPPVTHSCGL